MLTRLLMLCAMLVGGLSAASAASFDVFIVGGQSNAVVDVTWDNFKPAYTGSTGRQVEIINCAVSGTPQTSQVGALYNIDHWDIGGGLVDRCFGLVNTALTAWTSAGNVPTVRGVIWLQGEADAQIIQGGPPVIDLRFYQRAFENMIARFLVVYPKFFVITLGAPAFGNAGFAQGFTDVRTVQDQEETINARVRTVYRDNANYPALGMMSDSLHYTTEGYIYMGIMSAMAVAGYVGANF